MSSPGIPLSSTDVEEATGSAVFSDLKQQILESITDAFLGVDASWRYCYVNDAALDLVGKSRPELLGHTILEVFPELRDTPFHRAMRRAKEMREDAEIIDYYPPHDRWYHCRMYPAEGGGFSIYFSDYTERRQNHERLSLALDAGQMGAWDADLVAGQLSIDERVCELLGFDPGTRVIALDEPLKYIPAEDRKRLESFYGEPQPKWDHPFEFQWDHPEARNLWLASRGKLLLNAEGQPVRLIGVVYDISEKRRQEQELRKLNSLLRRRITEQDDELEVLSENVPAYFASIDQGLRFRFVNRIHEGRLGAKPGSLLGKPVSEAYSEANYRELEPHLRACLNGEESQFEMNLDVPAGAPRVVRVLLVPRHASQGPPCSGVLFLATDITQERRLQKEVLEVSEREKASIGRDIHDSLCQELGAIGFFAKALAERLKLAGDPAADDAKALVAQIGDTTQRARKLARGLSPVVLEDRSLQEALRDLAENTSHLFRNVECSFHVRPLGSDLHSSVATQLYLIAREASYNAARHGEPTQIDIELTPAEGSARLVVTDNGSGRIEDIVEGLGMRSMRYRARTLGGHLQFLNAPGDSGLKVQCFIPLTPTHEYHHHTP